MQAGEIATSKCMPIIHANSTDQSKKVHSIWARYSLYIAQAQVHDQRAGRRQHVAARRALLEDIQQQVQQLILFIRDMALAQHAGQLGSLKQPGENPESNREAPSRATGKATN